MSILVLSILGACNNNEEALLQEDKQSSGENRIVFGEKKGKRELEARNVFSLGEPTHFIVHTEKVLNVSSVNIVLKKRSDDGWEKLTEGPLEVKPEWEQFMNGLPASLYEKTGPGAYKLEVFKEEKVLAEGEFIIEKSDQEEQS